VRPHNTYCVTLLYPAKVDVFYRLQMQANEGMRIILHKPRDARYRKDAEIARMMGVMGWQTMSQFVFGEAMTFLFKIADNLLPEYLKPLVKFEAEIYNISSYNRSRYARWTDRYALCSCRLMAVVFKRITFTYYLYSTIIVDLWVLLMKFRLEINNVFLQLQIRNKFIGQPHKDPPTEPRDYVISNDPEEWKFVSRLIPSTTVPPLLQRDSYPSGYVPPNGGYLQFRSSKNDHTEISYSNSHNLYLPSLTHSCKQSVEDTLRHSSQIYFLILFLSYHKGVIKRVKRS